MGPVSAEAKGPSVTRFGMEAATGRAQAAVRLFTLALLVQAFHFAEHVAQVVQRSILGQQQAHGLLGAVVDTEWVHFLYNGALLAALAAVAWLGSPALRGRARTGGWALLVAAVGVQAYHFVEHAVRLGEHLATGVDPAPGVLGRFLDLVWFHFWLNAVVYGLMIGAFAALRLTRCPGVRLRRRREDLRAPCPLVETV